jgi:hypothetical protein
MSCRIIWKEQIKKDRGVVVVTYTTTTWALQDGKIITGGTMMVQGTVSNFGSCSGIQRNW